MVTLTIEMSICPKCGAYYAAGSSAFCLADGAPLVNVDPNSTKWSEGARFIEKKEKALRGQKRRLQWRRVVLSTMLLATLVVCAMAIRRSIYVESARAGLYKISGQVMAEGKPLSRVTIMLTGTTTVSTATNANGYYTFTGLLAGGSYTITPTGGQMSFTPFSRSITNLAQDGSADFFSVVPAKVYKISGRVMDAGRALGKVTIMLDGAKTFSTTTAADGSYTFSDLPGGVSYAITPVMAQMNFTPPNHPIKVLTQDESADFLGQPVVYKISGRVTDAGKPLGEVHIKLKGAKTDSATSDTRGYYTFGGLPAGGNYTVTPAKAQMTFTPTSHPIRNLAKDESADFSGQPVVYKISGRVTNGREPLPGVSVAMFDGAKTVSMTTNGSGDYTFISLRAGGNYTISPGPGMNLTPLRHSFSRLAKDERADFGLVQRECSPEDQSRAKEAIRKEIPGRLSMNVVGAAVIGSMMDDIQIVFVKPCTDAIVTLTYLWHGDNKVSPSTKLLGNRQETRWDCKKEGAWQCRRVQ